MAGAGAAGADSAAVARIFEIIDEDISEVEICRAICDGPVDWSRARVSPKKQDLLRLLLGALESFGPRVFLQRTGGLVTGLADVPPAPDPAHHVRLPSMMVRRKVAVYGGAFDPITNAHLTCAAEVVHSCSADEVWLVPCGPRPDKPNLKTPAVDRYCMCQVAVNTSFSQRFPVKVSDVECFEHEALYTYDLLCRLRAENPDVDLAFVIGTDWLQPGYNMCDWTSRNWDWKPGDPEDQRLVVTGHRMLEEFDFLVIKRPGFEVDATPGDPSGLKKFGPRLSWLIMPEGTTFIQGNLSSTEIRKRGSKTVREAVGKHSLHLIEGLVPRSVLAYIRRHGFYNLTDDTRSQGRIAIFGGAFDPVTNSHLTGAANIIHSGCADQVWMVPCGPRPDKSSLKTKPLDRFCMCKIAVNQMFSCSFPVYISDVEAFEEEPLFTYDLLCRLRDRHPHAQFSFVIGSDWLQPQTDMSSWRSRNWAWKPGDPEDQQTVVTGHRMLEEFDFLVIPRPGYEVQRTEEDPTGLKRFGPRMTWLTMPQDTTFIHGNLSSSEIRKRTAMDAKVRDLGLSAVDGLMPSGVLAYICREGLYLEA